MRVKRSGKGLTLVELVISLALLTTIIAASATFYLYGMKTFNEGESQARVQRNIRLAGDYLSEELRNTTGTAIQPATPFLLPPEYNRGVMLEGTQLKFFSYSRQGGTYQIDRTAPVIPMVSDISVTFTNPEGTSVLLKHTKAGTAGKQQLTLESELYLNNLSAAYLQGKVVFGQSYSLKDHILFYQKP